jgi:hypothetical protein
MLTVIVFDARAFGGQARASARIEKSFPPAFRASRSPPAHIQAQKIPDADGNSRQRIALEQREAKIALHSLEQGMSGSVSMQCAFTANLIRGIGNGAGIERLPAGLAIKFAPFLKIDRSAVHQLLNSRRASLRYPRTGQRSTAADAFDEYMRLLR